MIQMTTLPVRVKTGCVTTEGDGIYYEVRGQGQPLLMISGGGGDAGFYTFVADILADEFKVITYDRRGNSRSTRHDPQNFEISQQSRDAVAVLHAAGEDSALVFGNSGGAVIALDMAKLYPDAVRLAVIHEPPVIRLHPDAKKWTRFFASVYSTAYSLGTTIAMLRFSFAAGIPMEGLAKLPREFSTRMGQNHKFFVKHEMVPFTAYVPDVARLKQNKDRLVMAAGKVTLDRKKFYGETASILAEKIGCKMVVFPGHHVSYMDMPEIWAATLRDVLRTPA